jgi:hypothetical protein
MMLARSLAMALLALLLVACTPSASSTTTNALTTPPAHPTPTPHSCTLVGRYEHDTVPVFQTEDGLLSFVSNLDINTDGALHSYRADDPGFYNARNRLDTNQAPNTVCNGVNIRARDGSLIAGVSQCRLLLTEFARLRDADWRPANGEWVEWYGVAADPSSQNAFHRAGVAPCQHDGWLVSQTATPIDASRGVCDPERWPDAMRLHAIVLPLDAAMQAKGVALGDLAIVRNANGVMAGAIVGDTNPHKIGEGTVALALALRPGTPPPTHYRETIRLEIDRVDTFVFPGTASLLGRLSNDSNAAINAQATRLATEHGLATRPACMIAGATP